MNKYYFSNQIYIINFKLFYFFYCFLLPPVYWFIISAFGTWSVFKKIPLHLKYIQYIIFRSILPMYIHKMSSATCAKIVFFFLILCETPPRLGAGRLGWSSALFVRSHNRDFLNCRPDRGLFYYNDARMFLVFLWI